MKFLIDGDIKLDSKVWVDANGYLKHGKDTYVHRTVMEFQLGRKLTSKEVVHHIDHDKLNNLRSNLLLCTQQEHIRIHALDRARELGVDLETHSYCGECKTIKSKDQFCTNSGYWTGLNRMCRSCSSESRKRRGWNVRANRPNKWRDNLGQQYRRTKPGEISWLT